MIGGSVIVGACLVILGWTAEIVSLFVTEEHLVSQTNYSAERWPADGTRQKRSCTIALAVLSIYAVDFAINAGTIELNGQTWRVLTLRKCNHRAGA